MDVGTVFIWHNFPDPRDPNSKLKPRWFIYLGKTPIFHSITFMYVCTTTTQLDHYKSGGDRFNNLFIEYQKGQFGFKKDCILDIDINFYKDVTADQIKSCMGNIEIKGNLSESELRRVYKLISKSKRISKIVKLDIHKSFNLANITGLKQP